MTITLIIDGDVAAKKWSSLEKITNQYIVIDEKDKHRETTPPQSLNLMYEKYLGTNVREGSDITVTYHGHSHGGLCEFHGDLYNSPLDALKFDLNLDGILEAFYTAFELPKAGAWWHGLMGLDYNLIFNIDDLIIPLLRNQNISPDSPAMHMENFYTGLMVKRCGNGYTVSCLASYPHFKVVDFSINICDGSALKLESVILEPATTYYY